MSETNFENLKISETEANRVKISNLSDRPNAMSTYGGAKKSAADVKAAFDKPFELLADRHNALVDAVVEKDSTLNKNEAARAAAEKEREEAENARCTAESERAEANVQRENEMRNFTAGVETRLDNQDERMSQRIGDSGIVMLMPFDWTDWLTQTISIPDLGDDDLVIFYPASKNDREYCGIYGVFINPDTIDGVFTAVASEKPMVQITLAYYIIRGSLPELEEVE